MVTYKVEQSYMTPDVWYVVIKESGVVIRVCESKNEALAVANERASLTPGNRVES